MKKHYTVVLLLLFGCTGIPDNVKTVQGFELDRYLGTWYEIARLDNHFERGLDNVSATYTLRDDGGVDVLNRGRDRKTGAWEQANGRAYFIGARDSGRLKVSFFGPFYSSYNIIALDKEGYAHALVTGPNRSYLWILSRTPRMSPNILEQLVDQARKLGYDTQKLIYVDHDLGGPS